MNVIHEMVKDREPYYVEAEWSALQCVRYMVERNVGAVAVIRDGDMVGIFSERDLMKRVVSEGRSPDATRVHEVMTADPVTVSPQERIEECIRLMRENGFRHLPVCEGRKLKGLISLRDLIDHDLQEKVGEVQTMREYISQNAS